MQLGIIELVRPSVLLLSFLYVQPICMIGQILHANKFRGLFIEEDK
jgi:hypothetical protein